MKTLDGKSFLIGVLFVLVVILFGSWTMGEMEARIPSYSIACNSEGNVVYVANGRRVMVSKDYGETWDRVHRSEKSY